jgi:hypothetical protein
MNPAHGIGMRAPRRRPALAGLMVGFLVLSLAGGAAGVPGQLDSARWRTRVWGRTLQGVACWILGPAGEARLEIAPLDSLPGSPGQDLLRLLARRGEGTTIVCPDAGTMLLQPWGSEWRQVDPPLTAELQVLARAAMAGRDPQRTRWDSWARVLSRAERPWAPLRWRRPAPDGRQLRLEVGAPVAGSSEGLRRALVTRGRGRGGPGEIWRLRWRTPGSEPRLEIHSSRWPGGLEIWQIRTRTVHYPEEETFLPLWNLEELLEGAAPAGP